MPYLGKTPSQATRKRYYKTASAGDTSVSGTMTVGGTLTFTDGEFVDVSVNGVALVAGTDYNTNTANTIAGLSALAANDQVEIVVYDTFSVFSGDVDSNLSVGGNLSVTGTSTLTGNVSLPDNTSLIFGAGTDLTINHDGSNSFITDSGTGALYIQGTNGVFIRSADGGENLASFTDDGSVALNHDNTTRIETTSSGVDITGGFTATNGCTITTADNDAQLTLTSTDADASVGPLLDMIRDSSSPADSDTLGRIRFRGDNDAGEVFTYGTITSKITDASDSTEGGLLTFLVARNGSVTSALDLNETETVFNEGSLDVDFRVEGNGNANALVVHGADDFVGIGLGTPKKKLHIQDTTSDGMIILDAADTSTDHQICFTHNYGNSNQSGGKYYAIGNDDSESTLVIAFDANSQASLSADKIIEIHGSSKCVGINATPTDQTLKIGNAASSQTIQMLPSNASLAAPILQTEATRGQSDVFDHIKMSNSNGGDIEFKVRGDGQVSADGSFTGGGADYAEYFEWTDGNSSSEDRRGYSVVLDGNKVRKATADDVAASIIGIVSARPVVVGDTAWNQWAGRWERDEYGDVVKEVYTVTTWDEQGPDSNGVAGEGPKVHHSYHTDRIPDGITAPSDAVVTSKELDGTTNLMRPKEASNYDASQAYVPRENRVEWDAIGLMGKLRMRKGQPTGDRWIKLRDISDSVEEWLVR